MVEILGGQDFYKFQKIDAIIENIIHLQKKKEKMKCDMIWKK